MLTIAVGAALLVGGFAQLPRVPVEPMPEFTPPLVEVQTEALGLSASEVEQLVTVPLEADLLNGIAFLDEIRSESIPGLSSIELLFDAGTDLLDARQVVAERLTQAHALPNVSTPPVMIQPLSATSRVMLIGVSSEDLSLIEQSVLARWKIRPHLLGVPGVANVAIWGQRERQVQVQVDPVRLRDNGVSLSQVVETTGNSLWVSPLSFVEASTPGTGGFVDTPNQRLTVQHISPLTTPSDLARVTIEDTSGRVLRLGDVTDVVEDHQQLIGDAIVDDGPSLLLVVEKFPGTGSAQVADGVDDAVEQLAAGLPGLTLDTTVYDAGGAVDDAAESLLLALGVGLVLLGLVLALSLRDARAVLVGLVAVTLSLAVSLLVLSLLGAVLDVMLLAGIFVAMVAVVDDAVVDVHRLRQRLRGDHEDAAGRRAAALAAATEVRGALVAPVLVMLVAAVPLYLAPGLTGEFSRPLVAAYALALVSATAVSVVVTPALAVLLMRPRRPHGGHLAAGSALSRRYGTTLTRFVRRPAAMVVAVGVTALLGVAAVPQLVDAELLPPPRQRDLLVQWDGPPGTAAAEMARVTGAATSELRALPGVRNVGAHVGRAITSDEVVGVNAGEIWVSMDPEAPYRETADAVAEVVDGYPGLVREVQTYPDERLRAVRTGSDRDLVVRVYGQDLETIEAQAATVRLALADVDGVVDPTVTGDADEPTLEVEVDLAAAQELGINPGDVRRAAAVLLGGVEAGSLFEEQKVFEVVVWGTPAVRHSLSSVEDLLVDRPDGGHVRLGDVADVRVGPASSVIRRSSVSRLVDVVADVEGRDRADVVADVRTALREMDFPLEYHAAVVEEARGTGNDGPETLALVVAAVVGIALLLQLTVGGWTLAALLLATLPLAVVGGGLAQVAAGGPATLAALAGLLAVLGFAVRTSVVMVRTCERSRLERGGPRTLEAVTAAAGERVVPVLTSASATVLLLLPFAFAGGIAGFDVLGPVVVVVSGGLVTATLYTLFVVPALYLRFGAGRPDPAQHRPVALRTPVGDDADTGQERRAR